MCCKYKKLEESHNHTEYNQIDKARGKEKKNKNKNKLRNSQRQMIHYLQRNKNIMLAEFSSDIMHGEKIMH